MGKAICKACLSWTKHSGREIKRSVLICLSLASSGIFLRLVGLFLFCFVFDVKFELQEQINPEAFGFLPSSLAFGARDTRVFCQERWTLVSGI